MKKLLIGCLVTMASVVAEASYLNWQVTSDDYGTYYKGSDKVLANLYAVNAGGERNQVGESLMIGDIGGYDVSNFSDLSFYIEIVNFAGAQLARSETMTYAQLQSADFITEMSSVAQANVWHGGTWGAAPEPTSALLMMIGVGLLGLKRRKA